MRRRGGIWQKMWYNDKKEGGRNMAKRQELLPVSDPVADAVAVTGYPCEELSRREPWRKNAEFHTTGEFGKLGRGYHQHCGPTAMTNLVCAIRRKRGLAPLEPDEIFQRAAAIGKRRLTYWNIDEKLHMGGTSYLLLRPYVAACLRSCGIDGAKLTWRVQAKPERMEEELERGRLLVLAMTHHRCYGSHLVLALGAVRVAVDGRSKPRLYFLLADGWAARPRYVAADTLRLCGYVAVEA